MDDRDNKLSRAHFYRKTTNGRGVSRFNQRLSFAGQHRDHLHGILTFIGDNSLLTDLVLMSSAMFVFTTNRLNMPHVLYKVEDDFPYIVVVTLTEIYLLITYPLCKVFFFYNIWFSNDKMMLSLFFLQTCMS